MSKNIDLCARKQFLLEIVENLNFAEGWGGGLTVLKEPGGWFILGSSSSINTSPVNTGTCNEIALYTISFIINN